MRETYTSQHDIFTTQKYRKSYYRDTDYELWDAPDSYIPLRHGIEKDYLPELMSKNVDSSIPYISLNMRLYWIARCHSLPILHACNFFSQFSHCYTQELKSI